MVPLLNIKCVVFDKEDSLQGGGQSQNDKLNLEKLNVKFDYKSDDNIPLISLSINQLESLEQSNLVQIILENLVDNLTMVEKEYNKNLKIYEIRR